ncbi:hypothetical protein JCM5296_000464 [Sporobolomyces johnsonii]
MPPHRNVLKSLVRGALLAAMPYSLQERPLRFARPAPVAPPVPVALPVPPTTVTDPALVAVPATGFARFSTKSIPSAHTDSSCAETPTVPKRARDHDEVNKDGIAAPADTDCVKRAPTIPPRFSTTAMAFRLKKDVPLSANVASTPSDFGFTTPSPTSPTESSPLASSSRKRARNDVDEANHAARSGPKRPRARYSGSNKRPLDRLEDGEDAAAGADRDTETRPTKRGCFAAEPVGRSSPRLSHRAPRVPKRSTPQPSWSSKASSPTTPEASTSRSTHLTSSLERVKRSPSASAAFVSKSPIASTSAAALPTATATSEDVVASTSAAALPAATTSRKDVIASTSAAALPAATAPREDVVASTSAAAVPAATALREDVVASTSAAALPAATAPREDVVASTSAAAVPAATAPREDVVASSSASMTPPLAPITSSSSGFGAFASTSTWTAFSTSSIIDAEADLAPPNSARLPVAAFRSDARTSTSTASFAPTFTTVFAPAILPWGSPCPLRTMRLPPPRSPALVVPAVARGGPPSPLRPPATPPATLARAPLPPSSPLATVFRLSLFRLVRAGSIALRSVV